MQTQQQNPFRNRSTSYRDPSYADRRFAPKTAAGLASTTLRAGLQRTARTGDKASTTPPALLKKIQESISKLQTIKSGDSAVNAQVQTVLKQLQTCYVADEAGDEKAADDDEERMNKVNEAVKHAIHATVDTESDPDGAQKLHAELVQALFHHHLGMMAHEEILEGNAASGERPEGCRQAKGASVLIPDGARLHDLPRVSQSQVSSLVSSHDATVVPASWQTTVMELNNSFTPPPQVIECDPSAALLLHKSEPHVFYTVIDRGCTIDMNADNDKKVFVCDLPQPSPVSMGRGSLQGEQLGAAESFFVRPEGGITTAM